MVRRILFVLVAVVIDAGAAQQIGISAHFADLPADGEVPAMPDKLAKVKGANLLSSPRILVAENVAGTVEITQDTPVPGGGQVPLGVMLSVKTSVTERGSIWFSGNLRDRSRGGGTKTERLETTGFSTREWYFSGYTADGGTVVVRTTPATAQVLREGKTVSTTRELVVYLKFEKIAQKPAVTSKKAATSTTKKPTSTKKPSTTKSGLRRP